MNFNIPETIELTGSHLLYGYAILHMLYAFGVHYKWVAGVRKKIRQQVPGALEASGSKTSAKFCNRCMVRQFIPLMICGLELKIVQLVLFCVLWIAKVILGGGISAPFKLRLHKEMTYYPQCKHKWS